MGAPAGKRQITIKVAQHSIPIYIEPEDEELYRVAETALKVRLNKLGSSFKHINGSEFVLAALAYELMYEKVASEREMNKIGSEIDKTLSKIEM